jgi:Sec-independent protein translocase protein TatA
MGILLASVGAFSLLALVILVLAFARRLTELSRAMTALQKDLLPALETIRDTSEETKRLATLLEERAGALRRDRG